MGQARAMHHLHGNSTLSAMSVQRADMTEKHIVLTACALCRCVQTGTVVALLVKRGEGGVWLVGAGPGGGS